MAKRIRANNHSLAAGRDINLTIESGRDGFNVVAVFEAFCDNRGITNEQIMQALGVSSFEEITSEDILSALNRLAVEAKLGVIGSERKYKNLAHAAKEASAKANRIASRLSAVDEALVVRDFAKAYEGLKVLIQDDDAVSSLTQQIVEDCIQCGYLHFSNQGRTHNFEELSEVANSVESDLIAFPTVCFLAEMQQEHATRQKSNLLLKNSLVHINSLKDRYGNESQQSIRLILLEALCLRRLGERGDLSALQQAENLLLELVEEETDYPIEIVNTLANAQLRLHTVFQESGALERMATTLESCPDLPDDVELSELQAYPKFLNAYGNYYKQRLKLSQSSGEYATAIEKYTQAEVFWTEKTAPYEWAMIQKNKADVREIYLNNSAYFDPSILMIAHREIENSLKYRTESNAPYQFERSRIVKSRILELARKNDINLS
ncbi:hypothetical protein [uncultured Roseobacter sp.]|uniref:hypothetical protein n=1 Tax=uncultured Roseobacter sp. TaxID=114847 RepID=UPI0026194122|nr:hypothetical protein [uncultured Roseobacter sp.]